MKKEKIIMILLVIILSEIVCIAGLCVCHNKGDNNGITIREIPEQTVLYTVYRGKYLNICNAINELYQLADSKGIMPCGPVSTCCLNSSFSDNDNHMLTEIQIPVESFAIDFAGTLGEMTDVKVIPAMKVAVALQPEDESQSTDIIMNLLTWINEKGYVIKGKLRQTVNDGKENYSKLKTEYIVPIYQVINRDCNKTPCYM